MGICLHIKKQMDQFLLNIKIESNSKRIGILGASGCGKSMTLKCIAGILTPDEGRIDIEDTSYFDKGKKVNRKPQQRSVGYLFQNYALFPTMTVEENIMVGVHNRSRLEKKKVAGELIERFHLTGLQKRLPSELSGGQQQRVALARILAYEPEIILLDEPFSALDSYLKEKMQMELEEMLKSYEGTVILVSHSKEEIYRFSEELFVVKDGRVIESGKTKEVFDAPRTMEAARLTGCRNISKIERKGTLDFYASDWGIELKGSVPLEEGIRFVGIREQDLLLAEGSDGQPVCTLEVVRKVELPFAFQYVLKGEGSGKEPILFTCGKEKGGLLHVNDKVNVRFDRLMFLE